MRPRSIGIDRRDAIGLIASCLLSAPAAAQQSLWLEPTDGVWSDPGRWSNGVPLGPIAAVFGSAPNDRPFTVRIEGLAIMKQLIVANQNVRLDVADATLPPGFPESFPPLTSVAPLVVGGPTSPRLTLTGGRFAAAPGSLVGTADGPGHLELDGAVLEFALSFGPYGLRVRDGSLVVDGSTLRPLASHAVEIGVDGPGSAIVRDGGLIELTAPFRVGGGVSGIGSVVIDDGGTVDTASEVVVGSGLDASGEVVVRSGGLLRAAGTISISKANGTGSLVVDGGIVEAPWIVMGAGGAGRMELRGGALLDVPGIALSTEPGSSEMLVDGPATLLGGVYTSEYGGSIDIEVRGREASLAAEAAGLIGKFLPNPDSRFSLRVLDGASAEIGIVTLLGANTELVLDGVGSRMSAETIRFTAFPPLVAQGGSVVLGEGTELSTVDFEGEDSLSLHVRVGPSGAGRLVAATTTRSKFLEVALADGFVPKVGSVVEIIDLGGPAKAADLFLEYSLPVVDGWPTLLAPTPTGLGLRTVDGIDGLSIEAPKVVPVGFSRSLQAQVAIDGVLIDATQSVEWSVDDASIASIDQLGVVDALSIGATTVRARFNDVEATAALQIDSDGVVPGDPAGPGPVVSLVSASVSVQPNSASELAAPETCRCVDAGGTKVLFRSSASTLVPNDTNQGADVFLRSFVDESFERISRTESGSQAPGGTTPIGIDPSGRFVLLGGGGLVAAPPGGGMQSYIFDRDLESLELAVVGIGGVQPNAWTIARKVSGDGRFVLAVSAATNLSESFVGGGSGPFTMYRSILHDRSTGASQPLTPFVQPYLSVPKIAFDMSIDARFIVLNDDVPTAPGALGLVLLDQLTGGRTPITPTDPVLAQSIGVYDAAISDDGRSVVFLASGPVVEGLPSTTERQAYRWESDTGAILALSLNDDGTWPTTPVRSVAIAGAGRFSAYCLRAPLSGGVAVGPPLIIRHDAVLGTKLPASTGPNGPAKHIADNSFAISGDGRTVVFATNDDSFAPFDDNGFQDVVAVRLGGRPGDVDGDDLIDAADLAAVLAAWGSTDQAADLDGDGTVDMVDLSIVLGAWGT